MYEKILSKRYDNFYETTLSLYFKDPIKNIENSLNAILNASQVFDASN